MTAKGTQIIKTFEGQNPPENFDFPSITIEDIDRAVFELFDKKIKFQVTNNGATQKVPVVFASGERFALTRRKNPIRDKNNALILPIISILRGEIDFSPDQSGKKTAIAFREQESYIIKKRLHPSDRKFQNIVNKMRLKTQDNVASQNNFLTTEVTPGFTAKPGTNASRREPLPDNFADKGIVNLRTDLGKNIFEIIEIPYPEFVAINYDVVFWTQYMQQANEMIQTLMMSFEGQGEEITMKTPAGFDLVAFFKPPFSNGSNLDDYTESERVIKHSISLTVPGYILNPKISGLPNMVRSFTSAPTIDFSYREQRSKIVKKDELDSGVANSAASDQKNILTDITAEAEEETPRGESEELAESEDLILNPFAGPGESVYSPVLERNARAGETVANSFVTLAQELVRQTE